MERVSRASRHSGEATQHEAKRSGALRNMIRPPAT
jgi:hypothetical protein